MLSYSFSNFYTTASYIFSKRFPSIFDIPDRDKGAYAESIKNYKEYMESRGIRNFREGAVYDSPDGHIYTTRYCYSREDIEELAVLSGFRVAYVTEKDLPTGKGDVDLYFVLEKIKKISDQPISECLKSCIFLNFLYNHKTIEYPPFIYSSGAADGGAL
jgi:hypothetical protein